MFLKIMFTLNMYVLTCTLYIFLLIYIFITSKDRHIPSNIYLFTSKDLKSDTINLLHHQRTTFISSTWTRDYKYNRPLKDDIYLVYLESRTVLFCTNFVLCVQCCQAMNPPSWQISLPFQEFHCHIDFHPSPYMMATGLRGEGECVHGHR